MVDVPWHVVPGPAAQSFCPFNATPKHFSFPAATAALPSASVKGPAAAIDANADVTAPASKSELTFNFADIQFSPFSFDPWPTALCGTLLIRHIGKFVTSLYFTTL